MLDTRKESNAGLSRRRTSGLLMDVQGRDEETGP